MLSPIIIRFLNDCEQKVGHKEHLIYFPSKMNIKQKYISSKNTCKNIHDLIKVVTNYDKKDRKRITLSNSTVFHTVFSVSCCETFSAIISNCNQYNNGNRNIIKGQTNTTQNKRQICYHNL